MDVLRLRILARKSVHNYGYESLRDLSVQQILDMGREKFLISSYFGLDRISYQDDILDEIGITKEMRIEKPGKVWGKKLSALIWVAIGNFRENMSENEKMKRAGINTKQGKQRVKAGYCARGHRGSKGILQSKNHGR